MRRARSLRAGECLAPQPASPSTVPSACPPGVVLLVECYRHGDEKRQAADEEHRRRVPQHARPAERVQHEPGPRGWNRQAVQARRSARRRRATVRQQRVQQQGQLAAGRPVALFLHPLAQHRVQVRRLRAPAAPAGQQ